MAKLTLADLASGHGQIDTINANNDLIEAAINDQVAFRDIPTGETAPMLDTLDANANRIINLPTPTAASEAATKAYIDALIAADTTTSIVTATESQTATADQTAAEIKTAYESNSDTNEYSDAEQIKLSNIETSADVTDATNVASAGAVMESDATTAAMSFVVDEDNMASNSATKLSTQQAIKAYVDNQINLVPDAVAMAIALG
jgi:hypothetical protein